MSDEEITVKITTETDTAEIDALEEQLENLNDTQVSPEIDIDEVEERIEQLQEEIEFAHEYGFDATEAEAELQELQDLADELRAKLEEPPDMSGMEASLDGLSMMAVGDALQNYGSSAEGMAQQMNAASISVGQLATNTGIAEPQMRALIQSLSTADFPQEDAMAYVNALNQMGVSTEQLGSSASAMDTISDATGMTASQTISLTQSLRGLGVSADNLPTAFNAIAYAQANVNGGAGTLTQVFKKQAGTLNEYGVSVDQATLMMEALSKKGVQGMKMGSALSDVLKENNGDLSAVEQELGLTAGTLTNASQVTGDYQGKLEDLASEEGEHKTILEQLNAAWQDVSLSISGITEPIMSFVGLGGQVAGFGSQLNGTWELMKKIKDSDFATKMTGIKDAIYGAGGKAKEAATQFLSLGKQVLTAGFNALKTVAMWIAQKVQLVASTLATYAMSAAQALLNLVMSMNPIMLVVIAIVALIAVLVYLYYNVDSVRQAIDNLGASIIATAQWIYNGFMSIVSIISNALSSAWNNVSSFASNLVSGLTNAAASAISGFVSYIQQLPGIVMGEFNRVLGLVNDFINTLPDKVWDMGVAIIDALKGALGIGSPGHMFYMVEGEFKRIDDLTEKTSFDTGSIGKNMVDNFNPNLSTSNGSIGEGASITNVFNIDSVDNEDRINELVKAVEKALQFDNATAGRSV